MPRRGKRGKGKLGGPGTVLGQFLAGILGVAVEKVSRGYNFCLHGWGRTSVMVEKTNLTCGEVFFFYPPPPPPHPRVPTL